ncbi:hypothetical protein K8M07_11290 [Schnuerera sp. xch1]|uniref:hypothetical protein n=1 Tax=Schnuerera sp. xch1 TaxID=2874283 RepID=UPI001CBFB7FB|nr:hypothetical protein [Schnuerera sp. xch1]MBZ2175821.1 hypothetical protein [Schnuerera sp. xch1]
MNKKIIVSIIGLLLGIFAIGCENEALKQNDDIIYNALESSQSDFNKKEKEGLVKDFKNIVESDNEPYTLVQFIDKNIKNATEEEAVAIVLILEEVQEKYIQEYTDQLFVEDNQMELLGLSQSELFFKEKKAENIKNVKLKELVDRIIKGKYKLVNMEGAFYPIIDYEALKVYSDYLPDEIDEYINIKSMDSNKPKMLDAEMSISFDELTERLIDTENYIKQYPKSVKNEEVLRIYGEYLRIYLEGAPNTPIYDYGTKTIKNEVLSSYKEVSKMEDTITSTIVSKYIDIIVQNQNIIDENVFSKTPELHSEAIATLENTKEDTK